MAAAAAAATTSNPLHIIRLDGIHLLSPTFSLPTHPHTYTEHATTSASETPSRIPTADILITTSVPLTALLLSPASSPRLKLIVIMGTGTDHIDLAAYRARNPPVQVRNVPAASSEAVAEHAVSLFMAARRRVGVMHGLVLGDGIGMEMGMEKGRGMWVGKGSCTSAFGGVPRGWREEVMGVVGVGELGNRIATIARLLGMTVLLAERKDPAPSPTTPSTPLRPGRTPFTETLQRSTVLMLTCPLTPDTRNMISAAELALLPRDAIVVNVTRGGVVVEEALVQALREESIAGAATDVFEVEPASLENSVLVRAAAEVVRDGDGYGRRLNLVLSPHLAWYAGSSIEKLRGTVSANVEAWVRGEELNVVV